MVPVSWAWVVRFALFPVVAAGCGGGNSSPISLNEGRQRILAAICKLYVNCGEAPDQTACLASMGESRGYSATLNADIASGKVIWDGMKGRACVEAVERYYGAGCTQSALATASIPIADCDEILVGTVAPGGACFFSEECADRGTCETGPACSRSLQCCLGTCIAEPPPLPIGADCSAPLPEQDCVTGAVCSPTAPGGTPNCHEPSSVEGTPCIDFGGCALALYCNIDPATSVGTCARAVATGAACNPDVIDSCDDIRDFCDEASGICTRRSGIGGPCDPALRNCLGVGECVEATCVARIEPGESCSATTGPSCLGGIVCDPQTSTCVPRPVTGACG